MTQLVKANTAESDELSPIPGICMLEGGNQLLEIVA